MGGPVLWGVLLGVLLAAWVAVKARFAALPEGAT